MGKREFSIFFKQILFISFLSSCSLFSSDNELKCDDLVMTDETGLEIGIKGDPSDQWSINNPITNESDQNLNVNAAYPNPVVNANGTYLTFRIPNSMRVKIQMENPNGKKDIITEQMMSAGIYSINVNFENSPNGCFRFDFFFDDNSSSNAFGLVLVE